jgi:basic membrane protein A
MKKKLVILLTSLLLLTLFTACGGNSSSTSDKNAVSSATSGSNVDDESDSSVKNDSDNEKTQIYVFIKNRGDLNLWDSIAAGGDRAKVELADRADVYVIEAPEITENLTAMYEAADAGADLIFSASDYADNMLEIALNYPDITMVGFLVPQIAGEAPNIYAIDFITAESSFLGGIAAADRAAQDGTDTIGFVGGMDESVAIQDFMVGYIQGAKYFNPNIDVKYTFVGGWNDPDKAKTQAEALYNDAGATVVFSCAGGSGIGVHDAAANTGKYVIGVEIDQSLMYADKPEIQDRFLTSVVKNMADVVYNTFAEYLDTGTLSYGELSLLGIADNNAVGITQNNLFEMYVSEEGKNIISKAQKDIADGTLKVWSALDKEQEEIQAKINELLK